MKINKILFYNPSKITGGSEYLFKRCSEYLAENQQDYEILYADYPDGFVRKNILSDKVRFLEIGPDKKVFVEDGTVVILQLNMIHQLRNRIIINKEKSICLFWCLHQLNIKAYIYAKRMFWISNRSRKRIGDSLTRLTEMNAVKFMGYNGYYLVMSDLFQETKEYDWLPNIAPIKSCKPLESFGRVSSKEWKFCWLGRLDQEKSRNIETYMNELEELYKTTPLSLSLIGLGPNEDYLHSIAKNYSYPIKFVGEKREEELDRYILEETEIGLASGTSAFEFALRGKPVIIEWVIDRVYKAGERNSYVFTHEEELYDYSVQDKVKRLHEGTFQEKVKAIFSDYSTIVQKEYTFVKSKSVENCCQKLITTIQHISQLDHTVVDKEVGIIDSLVNKGRKRITTIHKLTHPHFK